MQICISRSRHDTARIILDRIRVRKVRTKDLWDLYFGPAVQSTLKARPMRKVVWRMTHGRVSFGTFRGEFRNVLDDLWKKISPDNHNLSDGFNK